MDIQRLFGASKVVSVEKFTLYVPDKDRDDKPVVSFKIWEEIAVLLLAKVSGRGATLLPPADGVWYEGSDPIREKTSLIYTYVEDADRFVSEADRLVQFIHTFGQRTNQGTMMFEWSGEFLDEDTEEPRFIARSYRVSDYPKAVDAKVALADLFDHLVAGLN